MASSLTTCCVLRSGGDYGAEDVYLLRGGLERHLSTGHEFVCLSDVDVPGVKCRELRHGWPGWWSKVELFRPDLFSGRVLYFDLDTRIVDSIDHLADYEGHFAALSDFYKPSIPASGVLIWDGTAPPDLYGRFVDDPPPMRGRLDHWWGKHYDPDRLQDLYPGTFGSYKADELVNGPGDFAVVCFHGKPRPWEVGWAA